MQQIIDTHCHYNLEPIYYDWPEHWQKAQENGVIQSIVVGSSFDSSKKALEIAQNEKKLFAAIGLHPSELVEEDLEKLTQLAVENQDNIVAIGEIGLDYYFLSDQEREEQNLIQKKFFTTQIQLANKLKKPLILHVRDKSEQAYWDLLETLQNNFEFKSNFVLHCVSGPLEYIKKALTLGAYIGFDGNITYKNAQHLREIFQLTPENKILLETDVPYLPPEPYRGQVCQPWMISKTAEYIQNNLGFDIKKTTLNAIECFGLK